MNKQSAREETVLSALQLRQRITTIEAMELLGVSESTARRLFGDLEKKGKVLRQYGSIRLAQSLHNDYSFERLMESKQPEKQSIAAYALTMIEDSDILFFDSGTTLYHLCLAVVDKIKTNALKDITIFTNSLANLQVLSPICQVILIGGEYRSKRRDFAGYASNKFISHFNFTKSFIGADGICLEEGLMTTDSDTALMDELAIARSNKTIVLTDSGKLGKRSFLSYAPLNSVSCIITGKDANAEFLEELRQKNISVVTV